MKKSELKNTLKPIIKECISEMLIQEGLLSNIITEVVKGLNTAPLTESRVPPPPRDPDGPRDRQRNDQREKLLKAISRDAYNGVDLFEGTEPMASSEQSAARSGQPDLGDPRDAGVDISSIMGHSAQIWEAMK